MLNFSISPITDVKAHGTVAQVSQARVELVPQPVLAPLAGRFAALTPDKLRGGYYTPKLVADWLARWALRTPHDTFLEPSCGDGAILGAGISRLLALGATARSISDLAQGVEITPGAGDAARVRVSGLVGEHARDIVETGDFFAWLRTLGRAVQRYDTASILSSFPTPARPAR